LQQRNVAAARGRFSGKPAVLRQPVPSLTATTALHHEELCGACGCVTSGLAVTLRSQWGTTQNAITASTQPAGLLLDGLERLHAQAAVAAHREPSAPRPMAAVLLANATSIGVA